MKADKSENVFFYVLIRSWQALPFLYRCIESSLSQDYPDYQILFIDDASDYPRSVRDYIRNSLRGHVVVFNKKRMCAVQNAYEMISVYASNHQAVVVSLDGDDWFIDSSVLSYLAKAYKKEQCWFTYGNCLIWNQDRSLSSIRSIDVYANTPYPQVTMKRKTYRREPFRCSHLRSWRTWLYKKIRKEDFLRPDGSWIQFAEDQAMFYPMLEMGAEYGLTIKKPLSVYNISSPNNDIKRDPLMLIRDELIIRRKKPYAPIV